MASVIEAKGTWLSCHKCNANIGFYVYDDSKSQIKHMQATNPNDACIGVLEETCPSCQVLTKGIVLNPDNYLDYKEINFVY